MKSRTFDAVVGAFDPSAHCDHFPPDGVCVHVGDDGCAVGGVTAGEAGSGSVDFLGVDLGVVVRHRLPAGTRGTDVSADRLV